MPGERNRAAGEGKGAPATLKREPWPGATIWAKRQDPRHRRREGEDDRAGSRRTARPGLGLTWATTGTDGKHVEGVAERSRGGAPASSGAGDEAGGGPRTTGPSAPFRPRGVSRMAGAVGDGVRASVGRERASQRRLQAGSWAWLFGRGPRAAVPWAGFTCDEGTGCPALPRRREQRDEAGRRRHDGGSRRGSLGGVVQ